MPEARLGLDRQPPAAHRTPSADKDPFDDQVTQDGGHWHRYAIALLAMAGISIHLLLRFAFNIRLPVAQIPLLIALIGSGVPLLYELTLNVFRRQFGSDLLAGLSIVTSLLVGEYLAGTVVVLMLAGGHVCSPGNPTAREADYCVVLSTLATHRTGTKRTCPPISCSVRKPGGT